MNKVTQTWMVPPAVAVAAKCYYARQKSTRVNVPRIYTVIGEAGQKQYVLVRYATELGAGMSSILEVRRQEDKITLVEAARDERRREGNMIIDWMDEVAGRLKRFIDTAIEQGGGDLIDMIDEEEDENE